MRKRPYNLTTAHGRARATSGLSVMAINVILTVAKQSRTLIETRFPAAPSDYPCKASISHQMFLDYKVAPDLDYYLRMLSDRGWLARIGTTYQGRAYTYALRPKAAELVEGPVPTFSHPKETQDSP